MKDQEPWWVEGALVYESLEVVAAICRMAYIGVDHSKVDNTDGLCLREQLYFDGNRVGINQDAGARMRAELRRTNA